MLLHAWTMTGTWRLWLVLWGTLWCILTFANLNKTAHCCEYFSKKRILLIFTDIYLWTLSLLCELVLTCDINSGVITHLKITKRLCRKVLLLLSSILIIFTSSLVMVGVLPLLHCSSSASSLWMASFIDLFFSFSFSYFFFHWSAVSSRFTVTVFRMVLALIRGTGGGGKRRQSGKEGMGMKQDAGKWQRGRGTRRE